MKAKSWSLNRLLAELHSPDSGAWSEFLRRFGPQIMGVITAELRRLAGNAGGLEADDVFQEVLQTLLGKQWLDRVRSEESLRAFLNVLAVSRTVDALRAGRWRHGRTGPSGWIESLATEESIDPRQGIMDELMMRRLEDELKHLPVKEELAVRLRWQEGLPVQSVARLIGVPESILDDVFKTTAKRLRRTIDNAGGE